MVVALVSRIEATDLSSAGRGTVEATLADLVKVQAWVDTYKVRCARRLQELAKVVPLLPEEVLAGAGRTTASDAGRTVKRADTLSQVPQLETALGEGTITAAHVDVVTRAAARLEPSQLGELAAHGERLTELARRSTPERFADSVARIINRIGDDDGVARFERQRRATFLKTWTDANSGMICGRFEFDPETGLSLVRRLDKAVERLFRTALPDTCPTDERKHAHLRALALLHLTDPTPATGSETVDDEAGAVDAEPAAGDAEAAAGDAEAAEPTTVRNGGGGLAILGEPSTRPGPGPTYEHLDMCVVVDWMTMHDGLHAESIVDAGTGIELPVDTIRRMACTANIIPVVLNSDGVVLDLGRGQRLATTAQRRALRVMYSTCAIPWCGTRFDYCQPHHLVPWDPTNGAGPTDMANLVPLCSRHHHAVHEGHWKLSLDPTTRLLTIRLPDGAIHAHPPPRRRTAA